MYDRKEIKARGFTLIELLVVISIIGLLSSVVLASLSNARSKAKISRTLADLKQIRAAIAMLENDTGKWPNGCPIGVQSNPEVYLDVPAAGIKTAPVVGVIGGLCEWKAEDISHWKGPYASNVIDPWGKSYYFDPDYCDENDTLKNAILSEGPDGVETYKGTCPPLAPPTGPSDDIVLYMN